MKKAKNIIKELERLGKVRRESGNWSRIDQWYLDGATVQLGLGAVDSAKGYLARIASPREFLDIIGGNKNVQ